MAARTRVGRAMALAGTALFVGALAWAWAPALSVGHLGDDFEVRRSVLTRGPWGMWSGDATGMFRPLASASAWLDARLAGWLDARLAGWLDAWLGARLGATPAPSPAGGDAVLAHVHSLLLYAGCVLSVALLARRLRLPARPVAAVFAALAVHVEAVAWLSARADLLATLFSCLSLAALLGEGAASGLWSVLLLALALCSKESAAATPLLGLLLLRVAGRPLLRGGLLLAVLPAWLALRARVVGDVVGGYGPAALPGLDARTLGNLAELVVAALRGRSIEGEAWPALAVGLLAAVASVGQRRGGWLLAAAFVGACLPVAGLDLPLLTGEGGRVLTLPSVPLALLGGAALAELSALPATALLAVFCAGQLVTVRTSLAPYVEGGRMVRDLLPALRAVQPLPRPVLVLPGWYGPACTLCGGWDAAAAGDGHPRAHPADTNVPALLYRAARPECVPEARPDAGGVTLELPACARWEAPWGARWERGAARLEVLDAQTARVTSAAYQLLYVPVPGEGFAAVDVPPATDAQKRTLPASEPVQ